MDPDASPGRRQRPPTPSQIMRGAREEVAAYERPGSASSIHSSASSIQRRASLSKLKPLGIQRKTSVGSTASVSTPPTGPSGASRRPSKQLPEPRYPRRRPSFSKPDRPVPPTPEPVAGGNPFAGRRRRRRSSPMMNPMAMPDDVDSPAGRRSRRRSSNSSAGSAISRKESGSSAGGGNPFAKRKGSRAAAPVSDEKVRQYEEAVARRHSSGHKPKPLPGMGDNEPVGAGSANSRRTERRSSASVGSAEEPTRSEGHDVSPYNALGQAGHRMLNGFADGDEVRLKPKAWSTVDGAGPSLTPEGHKQEDDLGELTLSDHLLGSTLSQTLGMSKGLLTSTLSKVPMFWKRGSILGAGTFGKVYRGLNVMTGELFAVKQIRADGPCGDLSSQLDSLAKEVNLMKRLRHENIVRYLGTEREGRILNVFLEYVPGGSIAKILSEFGLLDEPLVSVYTRQILEGLKYLHNKRIVHRDVKGANILVNEQGVCKLADFGASKQLDGSMTKQLEESMKAIKGTVPFMAPEVIRQAGHGRKADIWSLGATIIEMASGSPPWSEYSNNLALMFHVGTSNEVPPFPENLSELAHDFLDKCMRINPEERWSAEQLLKHDFVSKASRADIPRRYALAGLG